MKAYYCHTFELPLPEGHRFPMSKYRRLFERVSAAATTLDIELAEPEPASVEDLLRVHCPDYVQRVLQGQVSAADMRRIGFPWSAQMVQRSLRSSGGSIAALRSALQGDGIAVNLAGGTHHAHYDRGGGYCVFNDAVIAARRMQQEARVQRLLLVDLDVHQGDGSAALCADDASIYTYSMHAARNYPALKPASDWDVALADGTGDASYLDTLAASLPAAIEHARPDALIYLAGADPFIGDRLGYLSLSKAGLQKRDRFVIEQAQRHGLAISIAMAGGYAEEVEDIVDIHFATVALAARHCQGRVASPAQPLRK